jgi:uncharacterized protein YdiU (UPF0061 family)
MQKRAMLNLEYSYLSLPGKFYQLVKPASFSQPETVLLNEALLEELAIPFTNQQDLVSFLLEDESDGQSSSFAQAYAGHQFGNFTNLGDGRAVVMCECITSSNKRFDIQLKGSGRTLYSRGGDGKATLKAMLREYLISEAMHHLNIPTSRSLLVAKTGELVQREREQDGAVLARVMKSHIRIGTFEYARHAGTTEDLRALLDYTIHRLYPEIEHEGNPALYLLKKVMTVQIDLVVNWKRVGFIHGVMNTDNVAISGETFDYGPCAFMNVYHPGTVYSSIDTNGRYAFGNQPNIIKWNMARLAEALLPVIHPEPATALQLAQACIDEFDDIWVDKYYAMMLLKLGIEKKAPELYSLVDELLALMLKLKLDYTNTFLALTQDQGTGEGIMAGPEFKPWLDKWKNILHHSNGVEQAKNRMKENNPVFVPRNHLVEEALETAVNGNLSLFNQLLVVLGKPYHYQENWNHFTIPPPPVFENEYATYCGT